MIFQGAWLHIAAKAMSSILADAGLQGGIRKNFQNSRTTIGESLVDAILREILPL